MKKNKILAIVLSVVTLSGVLSGCATTESVIDKMFKAMSKQTSQAADMNLGLKADFEMQGVSVAMDIGLEGSYAYQQVEDKRALFNFDGDLYLDMLDQSEEVDFELYMDLEDVDDDESEASIYIKSSEDDMWFKQVETIGGAFFDGLNMDTSFLKSVLELGEEYVEFDGNKCYELKGDMNLTEMIDYLEESNPDEYENFIDELGDSYEILKELSDYVVMDVTYIVNKKTYLPVQFSVDFANTDFNAIIDYAIKESGESTEDVDFEFNFEKLGVEITYTQFGDVEIEIPEDALNCEEVDYTDDIDDFDFGDSDYDTEDDNDVFVDVERHDIKADDDDLDSGYVTENDAEYLNYVENYYPHVNEDETFGIEVYRYDGDTAVIITNLTDEEVVADGVTRFYDEDGNLVDANTFSSGTIPAGGQYLEWAWCDVDYATAEVAAISDTVYEDALDLSSEYIGDDSKNKEVVYEITNNGDVDLDSEYYEVLFFKDGELVDSGYLEREADGALKAGETDEYRCYYTEDWDECMVFLDTYVY